jgi:hypothetical protein
VSGGDKRPDESIRFTACRSIPEYGYTASSPAKSSGVLPGVSTRAGDFRALTRGCEFHAHSSSCLYSGAIHGAAASLHSNFSVNAVRHTRSARPCLDNSQIVLNKQTTRRQGRKHFGAFSPLGTDRHPPARGVAVRSIEVWASMKEPISGLVKSLYGGSGPLTFDDFEQESGLRPAG